MGMDGTRRRARRWRSGSLQAAAVIALVAGCSAAPADQADASTSSRAGVAQGTSEDPCRFATADTVGSAFGRQLKSSRVANVCDYRGTGTDVVVVRVSSGPEGMILRFARTGLAQGAAEVEKVATAVGEAYFDRTLPAFIGRVGNREVQIETTIQPLPRDAMIAVGTRIMETLARQ